MMKLPLRLLCSPVRLAPCSRALLSPALLRPLAGGCREQGAGHRDSQDPRALTSPVVVAAARPGLGAGLRPLRKPGEDAENFQGGSLGNSAQKVVASSGSSATGAAVPLMVNEPQPKRS